MLSHRSYFRAASERNLIMTLMLQVRYDPWVVKGGCMYSLDRMQQTVKRSGHNTQDVIIKSLQYLHLGKQRRFYFFLLYFISELYSWDLSFLVEFVHQNEHEHVSVLSNAD